MVQIYLDAQNKTKMRKEVSLHKSTMYSVLKQYSALKHRNPNIKTLAKIMYASAH